MPKSKRNMTIRLEDRASAFLRCLPDLVTKRHGCGVSPAPSDLPSIPTDILCTSARTEPDGSVVIVTLPSPAVVKWAARVAAESFPSYPVRILTVELPE